MTKAQVEVITSVQRRRRWSQAGKERIVAAAMEPTPLLPRLHVQPGSTPASFPVAARSCVSGRRFRRIQSSGGHARARSGLPPTSPEKTGVIEIEFASGAWSAGFSAAAIEAEPVYGTGCRSAVGVKVRVVVVGCRWEASASLV